MREIDTAAVAPRGQQQHDAGQAAPVRASGAGHAPKFPLQFPQPKESDPGASAEAEVQPNRRVSTREGDRPHGTQAESLTSTHDEAKRRATLAAQMALAGFELRRAVDVHGAGERFTVTRWNLARTFDSLDAVEAFGRQVGALRTAAGVQA